jgi:NADPH:quinone reductase-like Zn-dependent oxidoreductase
VQLTRAWGARPIGTARTPAKLDRAREYGLDVGIVVEGDPETLVARVMELTGDQGVNVTLDLVGGDYLPASIRASAPRARIMLIGTVAGRMANVPLGIILGKRLNLRGTVLRARPVEEKRVVTEAFARDVLPLFAAGSLRPTIDRVFPLGEIAEAHRRLASNETFGKVVLAV